MLLRNHLENEFGNIWWHRVAVRHLNRQNECFTYTCRGGNVSQFVGFTIAFCITWHHEFHLNIWWLTTFGKFIVLVSIKRPKVPKCLYGSKTMIVHLLPNSFFLHSERRGGWMVLLRQCFEYFYSLLPSIMFLFFEEEPPEIFPSFSLIQDSSDSATSYPE